MNIYLTFLTALRSLRRHKLRTLLTTLGIIIGVVAIIVVMSLSEGAKQRVRREIETIGSNFVIVLAGAEKYKKPGEARAGIGYFSLTKRDLKTIEEECDKVYQISPGVRTTGVAIYNGSNWKTNIAGMSPAYFEISNWKFILGESFTEHDVRSSSKVVVLGKTVAKELFDTLSPVGKTIRIKKVLFKVVGVLEEKGKLPHGQDRDDMIFAPVSTVQRKLMGVHKYQAFLISAKRRDQLEQTERQVRAVLRQTHHIAPEDEDDFSIFTQDDIAEASEAASAVLNMLLFIIASISLIVGGVGIMNIMLVTVTERTKEIGIRMALGATPTVILRQFLLEAITICLTGGMIGFCLGITIAFIIGIILQWAIFISQTAVILSLASTILIGVFFGFYPAYKASQLNPVEALATGK